MNLDDFEKIEEYLNQDEVAVLVREVDKFAEAVMRDKDEKYMITFNAKQEENTQRITAANTSKIFQDLFINPLALEIAKSSVIISPLRSMHNAIIDKSCFDIC